VGALAKATRGFTGADLRWVFERAADLAISEAVHTGNPIPITMAMLLDVAKQHRTTTQEWFEGVRPHVAESARDGLYNDVKKFLGAPSASEREKGR
jgi:SpoVK/Ycf46/Vps4 family AAA+-type ATPase